MAVGRAPAPVVSIDPSLLTRVTAVDVIQPAGAVLAARAQPTAVEAIGDFQRAQRSFAPRPAPALRQAATVVVKPKPKPKPRPAARSQSRSTTASRTVRAPSVSGRVRATGIASWYCKTGVSACHRSFPGGLYAAAGPALRVGDWRGRAVRVCSSGGCVTVRLIDWCACGGGRVIDLYSDAFSRIGSLSQGTMRVSVSW
jgi:rare lipoprotein A (peptidoglycan hydrolase)